MNKYGLTPTAYAELLESEKKALEFEKTDLIKERDALQKSLESSSQTIAELQRDNSTLREQIARRDELRRRGHMPDGLVIRPYEQGLNE
jgi:predicted nuclease with TOPRIM domain